ncbi:riboflavin synthase [Xanthomarina sp. F2636L]|uniref:riboflavin synthase n=1 Tax=Xanthomarina sp. F2636L TaxID=2996018 RepID=UPI00225E4158|nr:riboflavin synthase [Xanthomarina sp. F2636L]MCX7551252.1 riboflavin synthase [Xanthomarina sp. F2636L]
MFTGIIESVGVVKDLIKEQTNLHITISCNFTNELKIDQSVAHNGICLTVVNISGNEYTVTAIEETLSKTNLSQLKVNDYVNLERAMKLGDRLDGHIVQGHVDQTAVCTEIKNENGSWKFTFQYDCNLNNITIEKGSITVNGVSLTVVDSKKDSFSVAIIPYTFEHTNFKSFIKGTEVNLEFDVIGKYVTRLMSLN